MPLDNKNNINNFIDEKLSDLLDELKDSYGPTLFEELKGRIHFTISEFNEEMQTALSELKERETNRQKMYQMIKAGDIPQEASTSDEIQNDESNPWGSKINEIESK